jgi:hypothetical protein
MILPFTLTDAAVPVRRFLDQGASVEPNELDAMNAAYSLALQKLGLTDRSDPMTELVGRNIVRAAMDGHRDPEKLCDAALAALGNGEKAS